MMARESNSEATTFSPLGRFFCMLLQKKPKKQSISTESLSPSLVSTTSSSSCRCPKRVELEKVFVYMDENGDGKISAAELRKWMQMTTAGQELTTEDVREAVVESTNGGDGLLGFEDFVKLVDYLEEGDDDERNLKDAFRVYVSEGQDCITPRSLREALGQLGETKTIDDCKVMIRCFDRNGDGVISFDEFTLMMF